MAWVGTKVMWRVHKLDYKLGIFLAPYTPWLGKKIVKGTKTAYNESGARDTQRIMADVVNPVGIKVYKPKPTLFARILDGIAGIGKVFI